MKQEFSNKKHENFKKLLNIKEKRGVYEKKYLNKATKYIKYIKFIPGIQMVGVGNSLSMNSGNKNSDIDLLIVTKQNYLWIVRIITTTIFQILGVRKTSKKHAGRFCLSFFCTDKGMNFGDFAIKDDIYLYFWIVYFKPILDYDNTYKKFIKTNENWADFNEYKSIIKNNKKYIQYTKTTNKKNNKFYLLLEKFLKNIFIKKTLKNYHKLSKPYGIIINDNMLKFHNNDKRKQIKKELGL